MGPLSADEDRERQARRTRAVRRAARRRHPSARGQPAAQLRAVPANPTMKENTMPDPANPTADGYRAQLRSLLVQADDYAAALDEIAHDDPRRLVDVARQMVHWHAQVATVLLGIVGTPEADRGVAVADALTAMAEAAALSHANPISPWEHAARLFDPQAPGQDEA